jgi:iron complex outermembrane receptor protein
MTGGNLLTRMTHQFSPASSLQVQAYYDYTRRRVPLQYRALRHTFDLDVQQRLQHGRHEIVFGGGARASDGDDLGDGPGFFFEPRTRLSTLFSAFVQDEVAVVTDRLFLTGGAKIERNDFSGVELQPTARVRWSPDDVHTIWGAVSRAVRMPTRFDTDLRIRLGNTGRLLITGSDAFVSENVVAYEAGYRTRPATWMSVDIAAFANRYTDLRSQELPEVPGEPIVLSNTLTARTSGVEVSATAQVGARLLMSGSYSYLRERFGRAPGSRDITGGASEANDPSHIGRVRASLDLATHLELDATIWFASALPAPAVPGYAEMNLRFGWRPRPAFDLSIIGQHLLHDRHQQFAAGTPREYVARGVHVLATWTF